MSSSSDQRVSPAEPLFYFHPPITTAPDPPPIILASPTTSPPSFITAAPLRRRFSSHSSETTTTTTTTTTTPSVPPNPPLLSPSEVEKKPAASRRSPPCSPRSHPPKIPFTSSSSQVDPLATENSVPRPLISRLQKSSWATPAILRPPAVRLANPVNHVPRITPVTVPPPHQISDENLPLELNRDAYPLLTIPERRRSRLLTQSPNSLVVERSQEESESGRSSIAVPRAQGGYSGGLGKEHQQEYLEMDSATTGPVVDRPRHVRSEVSLRSQSQIASVPSNTGGPNDGEPDVAEELAWGPAHPCFPHINPHVPLNSAEYITTRIIRIRRDWMIRGDLAPTFSNLYPEILDPLLPEQEFRRIIATVNDELTNAFNPFSFRNWLDSALGLLTGWIWEDMGAPGIKSQLKKVEDWLERWNDQVGSKDGVRIWSLRKTAYMSLDVQIPDPKVGIIPSEGNPSLSGTQPNGVTL